MISRKALDKSINNGFTREEHFQAVANIEALYENAVLIHAGGDSKNNDPLIVMRRFAAPIVLNGTVADALLTAKESLDKENSVRVYSLELDEIVAAIKGERLERGASRLQRPEDDRTHANYLPEGIRKLQQKHEKVKHALEFFNENSSVVPSPGADATLAEPNGRHLQGGSAADTFERPWGATLRSALRSILSSLRAFLRRHGWNLAWTDNDLSALLARSARSVSAQSASNTSAKSTSSDPRFAEQKSRYQENFMLNENAEIPVIQIPANPRKISLHEVENELAKKIRESGSIKILVKEKNMLVEVFTHDSLDEATCVKSIRETTSDGTDPEIHAIALKNIENLLPHARLGASHRDWHTFAKNMMSGNKKKEVVQIHRFFVAIKYNGGTYGIEYTVREKGDQKNVFYTLEAHKLNALETKGFQGGLAEAASPGQPPKIQYNAFFEKFKPMDDLLGFKYKKKYFSVRFSDDPAYEAKAAAIAKILYRYTGTSYLVEPEEAASILAKGGWHLDPVNDEELLRYSAALAVKMKRERALKARHERERNAISNADEWTKLLMEKYGENFKINPGPKYDGSHEPFTGTWIDHRKTEKARAASSIPAEEIAKFLTGKTGKEVSPDMVVSHYADLKREGLLSAYREKRRKKSELYNIEQIIEEDERLDSGAEPFSTEPIEESEYKKKLRQKFQKEAAEKEQIEIDRWLYDNVQEWHWIADALGGLNLRFGFTLRPAARFAGEDFTGSFISPDWRRWSEYRPGKRSGKALADYKALREKHLKDAPVKSIP